MTESSLTLTENYLRSIEREISYLKSLLENGALYAPPTVIYHEPKEVPGFTALLERQRSFEPHLKSFLKRKFAARYAAEQERKIAFLNEYRVWHKKLRELEANDPPTPIISPAPRQPDMLFIGNATARASRRSMASDAVRSEEELNRVLLSLLEQERDNPATRWMATLAVTPSMLAANPKLVFRDVYIDENGLVPQTDMDNYLATEGVSETIAPSVVHYNKDVVWTEGEQKTFVDKFLAYPKNFRKIASFLPHKKTADCVAFYYRVKKRLKLKQLRRMAASEANTGKAKLPKKAGGPGRPPKARKPGRPPKTIIRDASSLDETESELSSTAASLLSLSTLVNLNSPLQFGMDEVSNSNDNNYTQNEDSLLQ